MSASVADATRQTEKGFRGSVIPSNRHWAATQVLSAEDFSRESSKLTSVPSADDVENFGPVDPDAERAILGSFILQPRLIKEALSIGLRVQDFFFDSHRRIYSAILDLVQSGHALDLITLADALRQHGDLEAVGGVGYVACLPDGAVPVDKHVLQHTKIVIKKAQLRELRQLSCRFESALAAPAADPEKFALAYMARVKEIIAPR
jgi:replicative DNA helicase